MRPGEAQNSRRLCSWGCKAASRPTQAARGSRDLDPVGASVSLAKGSGQAAVLAPKTALGDPGVAGDVTPAMPSVFPKEASLRVAGASRHLPPGAPAGPHLSPASVGNRGGGVAAPGRGGCAGASRRLVAAPAPLAPTQPREPHSRASGSC